MCSESAISLRNVSKYFEIYKNPRHRLWQMLWRGRRKFYEEYWACADVCLQIARGECFGLIGRNGAGKSTLLQIMAGILAPSSGCVEVKGRVAALLELGSGFNPEFTGRENVYLNAAILGLPPQEIAARYDAIIEFADIGPFIDQPVKTYSSGMALRLAFAVIANVDADILIIDEALAVGDAFFTQKCLRFLRQFMASHTVVVVSHDMNAITSLCTRAAIMENGRISHVGSPKEIAQKYLEALYEEHQGPEAMNPAAPDDPMPAPPRILPFRDMRQELFNGSTLRNDLHIFPFEMAQKGFGTGNAIISGVWLADENDRPYSWVIGGEVVHLHIRCNIHASITSPIVGFMVLNRLGQELFGDNTWLTHANPSLTLAKGDILETIFTFQMPILAAGEYHITAAIGEGSPENHVQHHWLHEAVTFSAQASPLSTGLMGTPMINIVMKRENAGS